MQDRVPQNPSALRRPIVRGAEDQSAALMELLKRLPDIDPAEDERQWEIIRQGLQETRRAQGQRLLFPE